MQQAAASMQQARARWLAPGRARRLRCALGHLARFV